MKALWFIKELLKISYLILMFFLCLLLCLGFNAFTSFADIEYQISIGDFSVFSNLFLFIYSAGSYLGLIFLCYKRSALKNYKWQIFYALSLIYFLLYFIFLKTMPKSGFPYGLGQAIILMLNFVYILCGQLPQLIYVVFTSIKRIVRRI